METVNIKMYKAKDSFDGKISMFAVLNDCKCSVSSYFGDNEPWLTVDGFMPYDDYEFLGKDRIDDMVDAVLIWEITVKA